MTQRWHPVGESIATQAAVADSIAVRVADPRARAAFENYGKATNAIIADTNVNTGAETLERFPEVLFLTIDALGEVWREAGMTRRDSRIRVWIRRRE
jgi:hypothetical protein